jgi:hypothetical protein
MYLHTVSYPLFYPQRNLFPINLTIRIWYAFPLQWDHFCWKHLYIYSVLKVTLLFSVLFSRARTMIQNKTRSNFHWHYMSALNKGATWIMISCRCLSQLGTTNTLGGLEVVHVIFRRPRLSSLSWTSWIRVRFEVLTAVTMKNDVFCDVVPCGSCKIRRFRGTRFVQ